MRRGQPVRAEVFDATEEGFRQMVENANERFEQGFLLLSTSPLKGGKIGAIFIRMGERASANLVGEF